MKSKFLWIAALVCVIGGPALAEKGAARMISVTGEGRVEAVPDMATIALGVTHQAPEAAAAMAATSEAVTAVLARLASLGVAPRDMQTRNLSLGPVWADVSRSGKPEIQGFVASNTVLVRVRDLDGLGNVLDAVIADGANTFDGLTFALQDPKPATDAARRQAVSDGIDKARQLAEAAGVTLGPVQTISDNGGGGVVMMDMAARGAMPVAAGEVGVTASVSMVFAIAE